ncbi:MAG: response regulator transcription factor [Bacteroidales bacterium]|nr:response regulator transcription factor [Bacteroidales bacterium]
MDMKTHKILLVDDENDVLEFMSYNLKNEGYEVFTSNNGSDAIIKAKQILPHLIILDVMMPDMDGIEACTEIKKIAELQKTLIIFLSARGEDYSQIAGFDAGADDYLTKPIRPKLLISRINALLRRYNSEEKENLQMTFKDFIIDREKYLVLKNNNKIILPKKEFEILILLTSKPGKVFTREEIFSSIWGNDVIVGDRTIDVHVRKIREKLDIKNIITVKGVGYKYEA